MKRNQQLRQLLLGSFLLLSCLLIAFVLDRYQESAAPEHVEAPPQPSADLSIDQFHYTETRDGKPLWELTATTAEHDLTSGLTRVKDVNMVFFNRSGLGDLSLMAKSGIWQEQQRSLQITSDVVLKSPEGYTCYADQMIYTEADSHLRSSGPVRLLSKQVEFRGVGLDIDIAGKKLQLLADVWSTWDLERIFKEQG
jgi:lipopolysaccharide export system protein LptC